MTSRPQTNEMRPFRLLVALATLTTVAYGLSRPTVLTRKITRRETFAMAVVASFALWQPPARADDAKPSIVSPQETLLRLRKVPVYCIVDGEGVPFMTYDSASAGANGYFFLNYGNAEAVLEDAKRAYEEAKDQEGVSDSWGDSRIVTLPLDFAMRLTVKQSSNLAQNGKAFRTSYQVLPSADDLETALRLENSARYQQRGRVPLFYVDGLTNIDGQAPVYFSTKDLRLAWQQQHVDKPLLNSRIRVRELSETFRAMIQPGGKDESVRNVVFVPSAESVQVAKQLTVAQKERGGDIYKLGRVILTK